MVFTKKFCHDSGYCPAIRDGVVSDRECNPLEKLVLQDQHLWQRGGLRSRRLLGGRGGSLFCRWR